MSIISGKTYRLLNKEARLALDLSKQDHKSILGEHVDHENNQTWIPEFLHTGGAIIKSKEHDLYIGFEGHPEEGKKLVVVDRHHAKVWDIERVHAPDYVLKLKENPHFVIEFPKHNLHPGTHAQLGVLFLHAENQVWVITLVK